jgi:uncharacterized repeat protein (TIGR01451 family)
MKHVVERIGLFVRLGALCAALSMGQQAFAVGTAAGTSIDNTVSVDYDVNGIDQADLTSSVSFVVDRRVDFTLSLVGGALVDVTPGENDAFFDLLLTNDSNSPLDFNLLLDQAGVTTVRGVADTVDMSNAEYAVSGDFVADTAPVQGGPQFVDELPADEDAVIRVWGDAALALLNGQVAGIQIDATAAEPGTAAVEGAALVDGVANTDLGIENAFADAGNDGVESQTDGFNVVSANLVVTKSYAVIAGDLGTGLPLPGATVEYTISVVNSSATDADAVILDDSIDTDVTLDLNVAAYAGNDVNVDNDGTTLACDVEVNGDGDGCDLVGGVDITVGAADLAGGITVSGNTTLTIQYQVTIPDPDPTP